MLSAEELTQFDEILADRLGQPRGTKKSGEEACSDCGLSMEESKLLASVRNGEVIIIPVDLFRDMMDAINGIFGESPTWLKAHALLGTKL
jgi:hypothetical protein